MIFFFYLLPCSTVFCFIFPFPLSFFRSFNSFSSICFFSFLKIFPFVFFFLLQFPSPFFPLSSFFNSFFSSLNFFFFLFLKFVFFLSMSKLTEVHIHSHAHIHTLLTFSLENCSTQNYIHRLNSCNYPTYLP